MIRRIQMDHRRLAATSGSGARRPNVVAYGSEREGGPMPTTGTRASTRRSTRATAPQVPRAARRAGYVIAIAVNAVLIWVVNHLVEWDVLPWLTDDFSRVVPLLMVSLIASIVVNVAYLTYDAAWFKSITQIVLLSISMAVMIRMYAVFPFDFSAYDFNWDTTARVVMIIVMVALAIGIVVEGVKGLGRLSPPDPD
jgi:hypothetical protein